MSLPARDVAARSRRAPRPSGDDRELAILATAERLLEARPLSAVSVDDTSTRVYLPPCPNCGGVMVAVDRLTAARQLAVQLWIERIALDSS